MDYKKCVTCVHHKCGGQKERDPDTVTICTVCEQRDTAGGNENPFYLGKIPKPGSCAMCPYCISCGPYCQASASIDTEDYSATLTYINNIQKTLDCCPLPEGG